MARYEYKVGGEVDSFCGRCKEVHRHVIHALVEGYPKRVECLSCKAVHNYRPNPAERRVTRSRTTTGSSGGAKRRKASPLPEVAPADAVNYSPTGKYQIGQTLSHPQFGLGEIRYVSSKTITVLFRDKERKLSLMK